MEDDDEEEDGGKEEGEMDYAQDDQQVQKRSHRRSKFSFF